MLSYIWKRLRSEERGFTLIELLIVILILGILAAIAIFASEPFRARAEAACVEANLRIGAVADAAIGAGVDPDLYWQAPGDCAVGGGTGGGGGPSTDTFTASTVGSAIQVSVADAASTAVSATADNLLVAVVGVRSSVPDGTPPPDPSATGWTFQGRAGNQTGSADRRHVAVFTRIASGTAADNLAVTWSGAGTQTRTIREFSRSDGTWQNQVNFTATNGVAGTSSSPFSIAGATGFAGSGLALVGTVQRDDAATGSHAFSNGYGGVTTNATTARVNTAFRMQSGTAAEGTNYSWTGGDRHVSGFVIVIR